MVAQGLAVAGKEPGVCTPGSVFARPSVLGYCSGLSQDQEQPMGQPILKNENFWVAVGVIAIVLFLLFGGPLVNG